MQPKLLPLALCSLPASLAQSYPYLLSPLPGHTHTHTQIHTHTPCGIIKLGLTLLWSLSIFKSYVELTFEIQQPNPSITRQRDDHTFNSAGHIVSHPTLCSWTWVWRGEPALPSAGLNLSRPLTAQASHHTEYASSVEDWHVSCRVALRASHLWPLVLDTRSNKKKFGYQWFLPGLWVVCDSQTLFPSPLPCLSSPSSGASPGLPLWESKSSPSLSGRFKLHFLP